MTPSSIGQTLRPLVAIVLTAIVLWRADPPAVLAAAARADLSWIAAAVLLVLVDRALMAYRWIVLLCPIERGSRPPVAALMRIFFISTFVGTFLPASVGGDIVRAYGLSRLQVPRGAAVASVLLDRLLGVVSIVLVGGTAVALVGADDAASNAALVLWLSVTAVVCVAALAVVFSAGAAELAQRVATLLPIARLRSLAGELPPATRAYARYHTELTTVLAGSIAVQVLRIVQACCLGRAIGMSAPLSTYFAFIPLILLIMLLPISINGIGTSQAAFVWFFSRAGTPPAEAFALSVMFVALGVVGNLPGGLLYAFAPAGSPGAAVTPRIATVSFFALTLAVVAMIGGGAGTLYAFAFLAALMPGLPVGRALFGARQPSGWICGGLIGYGLTAFALWAPIALHAARWWAFVLAWGAVTAGSFVLCRRVREPVVPMPAWTPAATIALALIISLVPLIMVLPYRHVGLIDEQGGRRYRAYFTADFVWHEALTAELARFDSPPRNPYMAAQPLHYYWGYFLLPSVVTGVMQDRGTPAPIEPRLAVNALGAGLLFVGAIFVAAWAAFPRAGAVGAAVALTLAAASAEGLYELVDLWRRGLPFDQTRLLNIDAITAWFFYGLTFDGLPRALWWGPQHATASALGLVALTIAARMGTQISPAATAGAGLALGLALLMSPFPAGTMTLTYGLAVLWTFAGQPRQLLRLIATQLLAVALVGIGLAWCLANGTFEGAGGAVAIGLSRAAMRTPLTILGLALGPVLLPAFAGLVVVALRRFPLCMRPAVTGVTVAGVLFFFVTLVLEPIWIGWRAGQQFLITAPALIAAVLAALYDKAGRTVACLIVAVLFLVGLPTTLIDIRNAQDTDNLAMGPGFRWTVRLSADEQAALRWIDAATPQNALVQMSLEPRGRETWSLIPSFARRRMAAGLPISLLRTPDYDALAARADLIFRTADGAEASAIARDLKVNYLYVGRVERDAFGASGLAFTNRPDLFGRVFGNADAAVYAVY